ncbi:MAG: hypothetical protein MHM6MM_000331 [Cercozoa sp. M6MM]
MLSFASGHVLAMTRRGSVFALPLKRASDDVELFESQNPQEIAAFAAMALSPNEAVLVSVTTSGEVLLSRLFQGSVYQAQCLTDRVAVPVCHLAVHSRSVWCISPSEVACLLPNGFDKSGKARDCRIVQATLCITSDTEMRLSSEHCPVVTDTGVAVVTQRCDRLLLLRQVAQHTSRATDLDVTGSMDINAATPVSPRLLHSTTDDVTLVDDAVVALPTETRAVCSAKATLLSSVENPHDASVSVCALTQFGALMTRKYLAFSPAAKSFWRRRFGTVWRRLDSKLTAALGTVFRLHSESVLPSPPAASDLPPKQRLQWKLLNYCANAFSDAAAVSKALAHVEEHEPSGDKRYSVSHIALASQWLQARAACMPHINELLATLSQHENNPSGVSDDVSDLHMTVLQCIHRHRQHVRMSTALLSRPLSQELRDKITQLKSQASAAVVPLQMTLFCLSKVHETPVFAVPRRAQKAPFADSLMRQLGLSADACYPEALSGGLAVLIASCRDSTALRQTLYYVALHVDSQFVPLSTLPSAPTVQFLESLLPESVQMTCVLFLLDVGSPEALERARQLQLQVSATDSQQLLVAKAWCRHRRFDYALHTLLDMQISAEEIKWFMTEIIEHDELELAKKLARQFPVLSSMLPVETSPDRLFLQQGRWLDALRVAERPERKVADITQQAVFSPLGNRRRRGRRFTEKSPGFLSESAKLVADAVSNACGLENIDTASTYSDASNGRDPRGKRRRVVP